MTNFEFRYACDGLVQLVRDASNPAHPRLQPYRTDIVGEAVWTARYVMRTAQRRGLYPSTAQLQREAEATHHTEAA